MTFDPTRPGTPDELREFTHGVGLEPAIDCSGNPAGQNAMLDALAPLGRAAFVGESRETTIRPSEQLIRKQATLVGSWYFGTAEYTEITRVIEERGIDLGRPATHTFPVEEAETAFRMFDACETEKAVFVF